MSLIPLVDLAWRASQAPQREFAALPEGRRRFSRRRTRAGGVDAQGQDAGVSEADARPGTADPGLGHIVNIFAR